MEGQWIGRKLVAEAGKLAIGSMQQADSRYRTDVFDALKASFERIEQNEGWTATEALQDHFNAITYVVESGSVGLLKETPALFRSCENMLKALRMEGANVLVTD